MYRSLVVVFMCCMYMSASNMCECSERSTKVHIVPITGPVTHAEGPHWCGKENALYYVDTFKPAIFRWDFLNTQVTSCDVEGDSVGPIIPIQRRNNAFVVCTDRKLHLFSWDGKKNNSGSFEQLSAVDERKPYNQFNDGKADVSGNLWVGTLTRNKDLSVKNYGGTLFKIKGKAPNRPVSVLAPLSISNGMAWNRRNTKFFFIDSETRKVMSYRHDETRGAIDLPELLFDLDEHPEFEGIPDGMTIDSNDNLWVAVFGGKSILQIHPETGKLLFVLKMPVTYVTSVSFGGPNLDIMYATTSRLKLTKEQLTEEPQAGAVFAIHNLNVHGLPANEFILYK